MVKLQLKLETYLEELGHRLSENRWEVKVGAENRTKLIAAVALMGDCRDRAPVQFRRFGSKSSSAHTSDPDTFTDCDLLAWLAQAGQARAMAKRPARRPARSIPVCDMTC